MSLSLRSRLIAGLVAVAAVLTGLGWLVLTTTRGHLVDQLDERLAAIADPDRDARLAESGPRRPSGAPPGAFGGERLGNLYEGILLDDGTVEVVFAPNLGTDDLSLPDLSWPTVLDRVDDPFTIDAVDGDLRYRALAKVLTPNSLLVRALPLDDVDETVQRLTLLVVLGVGAVLAVLAAVAWWVIRLGIRPIEAMTRTAGEIGTEDLTRRVPEPAAGTEAAALAGALNGMLGQIERAVDDQRSSEERLRRFVSDASHELRTPVTTILGYAELYRHGGLAEAERLDDAMRRTEQEARRMSRLVEDMLILAKLDRERPIDAGIVDLSRVLDDIVADARITAPGHVVVDGIEPGLLVRGDEDRLRQLLANLVGNAVVHTPPGTHVTVTARSRDEAVVVAVGDDGPGIEAEHVARLTERFYRADRSRARERGGSGLGLAIASAVVDAHGGSLTIDSEPGRGTVVTVRLQRIAR
ncbi:MAG: ATP-binding protein [Actinomycetota bacterium]